MLRNVSVFVSSSDWATCRLRHDKPRMEPVRAKVNAEAFAPDSTAFVLDSRMDWLYWVMDGVALNAGVDPTPFHHSLYQTSMRCTRTRWSFTSVIKFEVPT